MICPKCGAEYVPGVTVCYDCDVDLFEAETQKTEAAGAGDRPQWAEPQGERPTAFSLVTVFVTSDPGLLAIAETMLQSAGIPVLVEGAGQQGSFGPGPLGIHTPRGPSALRVAPRDAADARGVLADLLREHPA